MVPEFDDGLDIKQERSWGSALPGEVPVCGIGLFFNEILWVPQKMEQHGVL
jgi:hypothetical protein